ncbi:MAG: TraM recognition domain-containing protein, partial [Gammaproteobacteria bacterium]
VAGERSERLNAYQPDISIESVINKNQCVYFHCPATRFSKSVAIAIIEMFAVQARHRQLSGGSEHEYYSLLFDDWGKFVHDGFGTFMARARSANMPAAFSFQSIAQIKEVSHVFTEQMDDLAATKIFLRVQGESTIDYALRLFGQHEITDVSASRSSNHDSSNVSARYESRLEARQLKELDTGQCYITTQQSQGMKTRNPYWLAQFPLPDVTGWKDVELPDIQKNTSNEGLNFWAKYFNPSSDINVNELKKKHDEVLEAEAETNKKILANSGWGA